jgi:UDP-glucuronate decarboxylase
LMLLMATSPEVSFPVNLGNDGEFTIAELADIVLLKTGSTSKIVHSPIPMDDPQQRRPDLTLARKVLGWAPKIVLDNGLDKTIPWFRSQVRINARPAEAVA